MSYDAALANFLVSHALLSSESLFVPLLAVSRPPRAERRELAQVRGSQPQNAVTAVHSQYQMQVAVRPEQFRAADELVRRRYAWRGYKLADGELFKTPQVSPEPVPFVLLAEDQGRLSGTLTVRLDSEGGMLAEDSYAAEIGRLRRSGRRIAELVKLAVEKGADWKATLDVLVQAAYFVTRTVYALTDVLIEVNPRHVRFYERVFGFVVAAAEGVCNRVGAPSVLMQLDLEQFGRRLQLSRA